MCKQKLNNNLTSKTNGTVEDALSQLFIEKDTSHQEITDTVSETILKNAYHRKEIK